MEKRAGVFAFRSTDGKADKYVSYYIQCLKKELSYLVVVADDTDTEASEMLCHNADHVITKSFSSYADAYRKGISHLAEKGILSDADMLVLSDSEMFGPFVTFADIFEKADKELSDADTFSISAHMDNVGKDTVLDTHLIAVRSRLFKSDEFTSYWNSTDSDMMEENYSEWFSAHKYNCGVLYDTYSYDTIRNTVFNPCTLLKNGFPFICRSAFTVDYSDIISNTACPESAAAIEYVRANYAYDTDMIYENVIRCCEPFELMNNMQLSFVVPDKYACSSTVTMPAAVIVFHMYYEQLFDESLAALDNIPDGTDVIITTTSQEKADIISGKIKEYSYLSSHSKVLVSIGNGRDMAGLLVEAREYLSGYKYICFSHDKMSLHHKRTTGSSFARLILENVLGGREYISNVISIFENNDRLGLLVPPPPEHGQYFAVIGRKWAGNYSYFVSLCDKIGMPVNASRNSVPFALGTSFWCRYDALKTLFGFPWAHKDFPDEPLPLDGSLSHAIERCFPFVAKYNGYLCGTVQTPYFAEALLSNREYMLTDVMTMLNRNIGTDRVDISSFSDKAEEQFNSFNDPKQLKKRAAKIKREVGKIKRSPLFDKKWYMENYPEVSSSGMDAAMHYYVCGWKMGYDPSESFSTEEYLTLNSDVSDRNMNPLLFHEIYGRGQGRKHRLDSGDYRENKLRHAVKRTLGKIIYKDKIRKNADKKILVILHLFYMCSWKEIKEYLKNLDVYDYDLIVTYTSATYRKNVIDSIKAFRQDVKLVETKNVGYDVGPFLTALSDVDLDKYDIVFKLQSKGVNRPVCYIYGQYFRKRDWFLNLYEGCIGEFTVHKTIDMLASDNDIGIVAAKNLIVKDPAHKQHMVLDYMKHAGMEIPDDYYFVSGTCFAERAKLMKPVQAMKYSIEDFKAAGSGFSLAHKLERIICLTILNDGYRFEGNSVMGLHRAMRRLSLDYYGRKKYSGLRIANDKRFRFDDEFVFFCLENQLYKKYEVVELPLSKIKRRWIDSIIPLNECHPYRYLVTGDKEIYNEYCTLNKKYSDLDIMSVERFDELIKSIEENGFDEKSIVVVNEDNILKDGQHRCCYLMYKYGEDYSIPVLRCYDYDGSSIKASVKIMLRKLASDELYNKIVGLYRKIRYGSAE